MVGVIVTFKLLSMQLIATTISWGAFALRDPHFSFADEEEIVHANVKTVRERFDLVDQVVEQFLAKFHKQWDTIMKNQLRRQAKPLSTTALWLLTHTETHEFHHKGQIVSMARYLVYSPPDTDLVR